MCVSCSCCTRCWGLIHDSADSTSLLTHSCLHCSVSSHYISIQIEVKAFVYDCGKSSAKTRILITLSLSWRLNFLWHSLFIFKYHLDEELKNVFSLYSLDTVPRGHTEEQEIQSGHIHMVCSQTERIRTGTVGRHHTSARLRQADTDTVPCRYHKCDSVNPLDRSYTADTPETKHHMRF